MIYLDTSFLAPFYIQEATSSQVEAILLKVSIGKLAISHWTRVEFASLLARRLRMGELTAENVEKVMEAFVTNINNTYVCFPVEPTDFNQAATLLMQGNTALRAGDALHLSIALNRKTDNFLTLDRKLLAAANVLGVTASSGVILT